MLSAALVTNADLRQTLLEAQDPADRADLLIEHLGDLIAHMGPQDTVN